MYVPLQRKGEGCAARTTPGLTRSVTVSERKQQVKVKKEDSCRVTLASTPTCTRTHIYTHTTPTQTTKKCKCFVIFILHVHVCSKNVHASVDVRGGQKKELAELQVSYFLWVSRSKLGSLQQH